MPELEMERTWVYNNKFADVHPLADVEDPEGSLNESCTVWRFSHVREGARLGKNVMIGNNCFIDKGVTIGSGTRIQNGVSVYSGTVIGKEVFVGPSVTFSNCRFPAIRSGEMPPFSPDNIIVEDYATIGLNATIIAPAILGEGCFIGGGSIVTSDIFPYTLVYGSPTKVNSGICRHCRRKIPIEWVMGTIYYDSNQNIYVCPECSTRYRKMMRGDGLWEGHIVIEDCGREK